jgi:hypothetical protein
MNLVMSLPSCEEPTSPERKRRARFPPSLTLRAGRFPLILLVLYFVATPLFAAPITFDEADARLRHAYALARETNDAPLADRMLNLRDRVKAAFDRKDLAAAEFIVRDAEEQVGLDPGGKTMYGLPVAHPDSAEEKKLEAVTARLAAAMRKGDGPGVTSATAEMAKVLGDQAGVPDVRRKGDKTEPLPIKPADVADLFIKVIEADPRATRALAAGVPGSETMPRAYASVVHGCVAIRPLVAKYLPTKLEELDGLVAGCCKAMVALQVDAGFFKFPDLRGKSVRFGERIDRLVKSDPDAVQDGWLVVADPDGASQFDAGECGIALLRAGAAYKNADWTKAAREAADWAITQPCVPDWNANAFSVSLLCEAYRATGEKKYLEGAEAKFAIGVRPGQAANGRWVEPHNARTVYHVILLRACLDMEDVLPGGKEREAAADASRRAVAALIEEAEKLGPPTTGHTIQDLVRHLKLHPKAPKSVRIVLEQAATAAIRKCSQAGRIKAAVPLPELAAAAGVWE